MAQRNSYPGMHDNEKTPFQAAEFFSTPFMYASRQFNTQSNAGIRNPYDRNLEISTFDPNARSEANQKSHYQRNLGVFPQFNLTPCASTEEENPNQPNVNYTNKNLLGTPQCSPSTSVNNMAKDEEILQLRRQLERITLENEIIQQQMARNNTAINSHVQFRRGLMHPDDVKQIIPEFNPDNNMGLTAEYWVRKLKLFYIQYGWSEFEAMHYATSRLRGPAQLWFHDVTQNDMTFESFCMELIRRFQPVRNEMEIFHRMKNRKKQHNETYSQYVYDIMRIARQGCFSEAAIMTCIIENITDQMVSKMLALTPYRNVDEMLIVLQRFDSTNAVSKAPNFTDKPKYRDVNRSNNTTTTKPDVNNDPSSSLRCYNCNNKGHRSINCSQPQRRERCEYCNKTGHSQADCYKRKNSSKPNNQTVGNITTDEITIPIKFIHENGDVDITGILDTGSPINLIKLSAVPEFVKLSDYCGRVYKGLNNSKLSIIGKFTVKSFVFNKFVFLNFLVVPEASMVYDCLLGREFLRDSKVGGFMLNCANTSENIEIIIPGIKNTNRSFGEDRVDLSSCPILNSNFNRKTTTEELKDLLHAIPQTKINDVETRESSNCNDTESCDDAHDMTMDCNSNNITENIENITHFNNLNVDEILHDNNKHNFDFDSSFNDIPTNNLCDIDDVIPTNNFYESDDNIPNDNFGELNEILSVNYFSDSTDSVDFDIGPFCHDFQNDLRIKKQCAALLEDFLHRSPKSEPIVQHEMRINLNCDKVFYCTPKRMSMKEKQIVDDLVKDLLDRDIIRPSNSEYASRTVLVEKKNGNKRLCIDYRELNKITVKDRFPLPRIDDCLDMLNGKSCFSLLDLKNGFFHIPIEEQSIKYTSFVTPNGQFEFLKTPFGLCNAPSVFQRFVFQVFSEIIRSGDVIIYMDDILIATDTVERHFEVLKRVLDLMHENCLQIQPSKCVFFKARLEFIGYEISVEGVSPSKRHTDAISNYPVPKTVHDVHRFLGLAGFFRRFICNFSLIAKPLSDLIKKDTVFKFQSAELTAFQTLQTKLASAPVLKIYDHNLDTELHTDASKIGFGAILLQRQTSGDLHPVSFFSKRSTEAESRKHSFELEALAVIYAIKRFHVYLHGIPFKIITDCLSFKQTLQKKDSNSQVMRWSLFLENYDYEIIQRDGTRMRHVDALSRAPGICAISECSFFETLASFQGSDQNVRLIKSSIKVDNDNDFYTIRDNLLYRKDKDKILLYVPDILEQSVIRQSHEIGHFGSNKTIELIRRTFWFPKMKEKVENFIKTCLKCLFFSPKDGKQEGHLHIYEKFDKPFHTIHVDHVGPFNETRAKNKYILVIVDGFTKFVRFFPTKTTNTREVLNRFKFYFNQYSTPIRVIADRGTCFRSKEFKSFLSSKDIQLISTATDSPQSNGQAERQNRTLLPILSKLIDVDRNHNWDNILVDAEFAFNNSFNRSIKTTPSMALFGVNQTKTNDNVVRFVEILNEEERDLIKIRKKIVDENLNSQLENKVNFDKRRKAAYIYKEGDIVFVKNKITEAGLSKKLVPKFRGPYMVTRVLPNERYLVEDLPDQKLSNIPYKSVCAPFNMKPLPGRTIESIEASELAE